MATTITVRDVDPAVFRGFKAHAVQQHITLGTALNLAMEKFMSLQKKIKLSDFKPIRVGKGTEHLSEQVDAILYGD